jgi:hypothetical protein
MTPLRIIAFASIFISTTFSLAADQPRNLAPYNVVVCQPNARCLHHTIFGHDYKILSTDRFTVMVSLSSEGRYTRADVSITNLSSTPIHLSPEDFRIQALTSRSKVFFYVPPSQLENIPAPTRVTPNAAADAPPPLANPNPNPNPELSELDAARQRATQEALELQATTPHLKAIIIPPNQAVHGRVYFERDPSATPQQVNVVLPIAGTVFKFPDVIKP